MLLLFLLSPATIIFTPDGDDVDNARYMGETRLVVGEPIPAIVAVAVACSGDPSRGGTF